MIGESNSKKCRAVFSTSVDFLIEPFGDNFTQLEGDIVVPESEFIHDDVKSTAYGM